MSDFNYPVKPGTCTVTMPDTDIYRCQRCVSISNWAIRLKYAHIQLAAAMPKIMLAQPAMA